MCLKLTNKVESRSWELVELYLEDGLEIFVNDPG